MSDAGVSTVPFRDHVSGQSMPFTLRDAGAALYDAVDDFDDAAPLHHLMASGNTWSTTTADSLVVAAPILSSRLAQVDSRRSPHAATPAAVLPWMAVVVSPHGAFLPSRSWAFVATLVVAVVVVGGLGGAVLRLVFRRVVTLRKTNTAGVPYVVDNASVPDEVVLRRRRRRKTCNWLLMSFSFVVVALVYQVCWQCAVPGSWDRVLIQACPWQFWNQGEDTTDDFGGIVETLLAEVRSVCCSEDVCRARGGDQACVLRSTTSPLLLLLAAEKCCLRQPWRLPLMCQRLMPCRLTILLNSPCTNTCHESWPLAAALVRPRLL